MSPARTGHKLMRVLVVRAWIEHDHPEGFRARILTTTAQDGEADPGVVVSSPAAALLVVAQWLEELIRDVTPP